MSRAVFSSESPGIAGEIEKRQVQLAALPGVQRGGIAVACGDTAASSLSLSSEERQGLREKQEQLERRLYQLLPELKPRVVEVNDVASLLPDSGASIEFQRYDRYDGKKNQVSVGRDALSRTGSDRKARLRRLIRPG